MAAHIVAYDGGVNGGGYLCGAGGLCSVADYAADISQSVDNCVAYLLIVAAEKIGYARSRGTCGADRSAEGGERADIFLQVDGNKVAENKGLIELLLAYLQVLCVFDNGQTDGHTLISRTGIYDNGQSAAAHSRVRACRSHCAGTGAHIVAEDLQHSVTHACSVVAPETLAGNGGVEFDLGSYDVADILDIHLVSEDQNAFNIQTRIILGSLLRLGNIVAEDDLSVLFNAGDESMAVDNADRGAVLTRGEISHHIEVVHVLNESDGAKLFRHKSFAAGDVLRLHAFKNLKLAVRAAADRAEDGGGFNTHKSAGIGHGYSLYIFDYVARTANLDMLRLAAQHRPCLRGGIGYGNRLCAAKRGDKLVLKNSYKIAVMRTFHSLFSLSLCFFYYIVTRYSAQHHKQKRDAVRPFFIHRTSKILLFPLFRGC